MTPPPVAHLAFLTEPEPGTFLLNLSFAPNQDRVSDVQLDGSRHERVQITASQLALIVADGARMGLPR